MLDEVCETGTAVSIIAASAKLRSTLNPPKIGEWLVCPSGHVLAQMAVNKRTGFSDWAKYSGSVITVTNGRRVITCGFCGEEAHNSERPFICWVVPDQVVKKVLEVFPPQSAQVS